VTCCPAALLAEVVPWRDAYDERGAIMQFTGDMARDEAEVFAYADVLSLWRQDNPVGQEGDFLALLVAGGANLPDAVPPAPAPHRIGRRGT
jgi:hypothetical protein